MKIKQDHIMIDDTYIDYISFGKGSKPLVLIPGLSLKDVKGSGVAIAYMYRIFSKDYRVFCIDRKGTIPLNYTDEEIAEDYAFAMKVLNIDHAYILGISQGGMIAQYLAINHPELVQKLALGITLSKNNETVISCINNWVSMAESDKFQELGIDILKKMYSTSYIKKYSWLFPLIGKLSKPKQPNRFITLAKSCLTCNTYEKLKEIKCPVYVIGGNKDNVVTGEASYEIAEVLGCDIYMYEDLGHSVYEETKDFNERIYKFFEE